MITPELAGAFTGGISCPMLKSIGVEWALAGHSERRTINRETDEYINSQCLNLIGQGMSVILCIGETLEEFEKSLVGAVCEVQLKKGLSGIKAEEMDRVVIACKFFLPGINNSVLTLSFVHAFRFVVCGVGYHVFSSNLMSYLLPSTHC